MNKLMIDDPQAMLTLFEGIVDALFEEDGWTESHPAATQQNQRATQTATYQAILRAA